MTPEPKAGGCNGMLNYKVDNRVIYQTSNFVNLLLVFSCMYFFFEITFPYLLTIKSSFNNEPAVLYAFSSITSCLKPINFSYIFPSILYVPFTLVILLKICKTFP